MTALHFPSRVTQTPRYTDFPLRPRRRCVVGAFALTAAAVTADFRMIPIFFSYGSFGDETNAHGDADKSRSERPRTDWESRYRRYPDVGAHGGRLSEGDFHTGQSRNVFLYRSQAKEHSEAAADTSCLQKFQVKKKWAGVILQRTIDAKTTKRRCIRKCELL